MRLESSIDIMIDHKARNIYEMHDIERNLRIHNVRFFYILFTFIAVYQDIAVFKRKFINYSYYLKTIYINSSS